jgi:hypothetical protein
MDVVTKSKERRGKGRKERELRNSEYITRSKSNRGVTEKFQQRDDEESRLNKKRTKRTITHLHLILHDTLIAVWVANASTVSSGGNPVRLKHLESRIKGIDTHNLGWRTDDTSGK